MVATNTAIVSSTVLYGLDISPFTEKIQSRLDVVQRTMLRKMIGWVSSTEDDWETIGHKMKERLRRCLELYPIADWSET